MTSKRGDQTVSGPRTKYTEEQLDRGARYATFFCLVGTLVLLICIWWIIWHRPFGLFGTGPTTSPLRFAAGSALVIWLSVLLFLNARAGISGIIEWWQGKL